MRRRAGHKSKRPRLRQRDAAGWIARHILVPMDFSGFARQALTCAVPLARQCRAKISLVHVVRPLAGLHTFPDGGLGVPADTSRLRTAARRHLADLAEKLLPDELRGRTFVREGDPGTEIAAVAKSLKVDLIVLSNTGRSGLSRLFLGSTAESILSDAPCSVLTVRRQPSGPAMRLLSLTQPLYTKDLPWGRILVPVDFSVTSLRTLKVAAALARLVGARLLLLHVIEPNPYPTGLEGAILVIPDAELTRKARKQLPQVARRFIPESVRVSSFVARGRAANTIVSMAERKRADLIMLGTHDPKGMQRLFLGGTTAQVVRQATCPVFAVRRQPLPKRAGGGGRNRD